MNSYELERFVSGRLQRLPAPRAPLTLLPRVLAAAKAWAERPWYAREWFTWPLQWQVGSIGLLVLTLISVFLAIPVVQSTLLQSTSAFTSSLQIDIPRMAGDLQASTATARVIWRAIVQPFLPYAFAIVVLMCGACATVVFVLNRIVFGRILHS